MGEGKKIKGRSRLTANLLLMELNGEWAKQPVCRNVLEQTHYFILGRRGPRRRRVGAELCKCGKIKLDLLLLLLLVVLVLQRERKSSSPDSAPVGAGGELRLSQ